MLQRAAAWRGSRVIRCAVFPRYFVPLKRMGRHLYSTDPEIFNDLSSTALGSDNVNPMLERSRTESPLMASPMLAVGDYVEVFRDGQYSGLVLDQKLLSGRLQRLTVLLRNGKQFTFRSDQVAFRIEDIAHQADFKQLIKAPENLNLDINSMKTVSAEYSRAIQQYQRLVKYEKAKALRALDKMYDHFQKSSSSPHEQQVVHMDDLARYAFGCESPTPLQRHATFMYLVGEHVHFAATHHVYSTGEWILRSTDESQRLSKVIDWIRMRDPVYTGFLDRARELVQFSQAHADPLLGTFSSSVRDLASVHTSKLTGEDRILINFIADWVKSSEVSLSSPHDAIVPTILKGLQCYDTTFIDKSVAIMFLKHVGMFRPWDNIGLLEDAPVVREFFWSDKATANNTTMDTCAAAFMSNKPCGFYDRDPCDAIRHDFGDLPVYTIDDPTAKEIDDGISIEYVPGEKDPWIHIHVADPSAYIPPDHPLADIMRHRVQTIYLPEQHFPMLPDSLASKKMSLGISAHQAPRRNGAQYALSFSAKVDENGHLHSARIRPSLIKNVKAITYDAVDTLLEPQTAHYTNILRTMDPLLWTGKTLAHPLPSTLLSSPDKPANTMAKAPLSPVETSQLSNLFHVGRRLLQNRIDHGAVLFSFPSPTIGIDPCPLDLPSTTFTEPHFVTAVPALRVSQKPSIGSPARNMVAEMMIAAGRIAGQFAQEKGIVLPFRSQQWRANMSTADEHLRDTILNERHPETGSLPVQSMLRFLSIFPPTSLTTTPGLAHAIMGIPNGYVKATSPLRRYLDLVAHWQLKAHFTQSVPAFSRQDLDSLLPKIESQEKQLAFVQQRAVRFWAVEMLRRLQLEPFSEEMEWTVLVSQQNRASTTDFGTSMEVAYGILLEVGIPVRLEKLDRSLAMGDVVKARITHLDTLSGQASLALL